jgi:hypothetical protein
MTTSSWSRRGDLLRMEVRTSGHGEAKAQVDRGAPMPGRGILSLEAGIVRVARVRSVAHRGGHHVQLDRAGAESIRGGLCARFSRDSLSGSGCECF